MNDAGQMNQRVHRRSDIGSRLWTQAIPRFATTDWLSRCLYTTIVCPGSVRMPTEATTLPFCDHWDSKHILDEGIRFSACRPTASAQKQNVTVYRLITKGTIEETILQYQNRQDRARTGAGIEEDKGGFKNLTREELLSCSVSRNVCSLWADLAIFTLLRGSLGWSGWPLGSC